MHDDDPVLTYMDRCDSCGARAFARVTVRPGSDLNFCAHHWDQYQAKLKAAYPVWLDETQRLHAEEAERVR